MSETPRTDVLHQALVKRSELPDWVVGTAYVEMTDFARQLERDLAAAQAQLAEARMDAERYRLLRDGKVDDIAVVRGLGTRDYGMSAVLATYEEEIDGADLDAAINRARGEQP